MLRCPTCSRVYSDDSLNFCRLDGTELTTYDDDARATLVRLPQLGYTSISTEPMRPPELFRLSQITFGETIEQYPSWSPNSEEFAFSREEAGIRSIFVKNLGSGEERRLTNGNYDDIQSAWSPDGSTILFVRAHQPNVKLEPGDVFGSFYHGDIWAIDVASGKE